MRIYLEGICKQGAIFIITLFLLSSFFQGCTNSDSNDIFISSPKLEMNPNGNTPLAGRIVFSTIDEYKTQMTMSDGETQETVQFSQFQTEHEYMVLGCKPGRAYTLDLTLEDYDANLRTYEQVVTFETDDLPSDFPSMAVTSDPERMEPGITLFSPTNFNGTNQNNYMIAVDANGEVVWYYIAEGQVNEIKRLSNGNLLSIIAGMLVEIDMLGRTIALWKDTMDEGHDEDSIILDTLSMHHDVIEISGDRFWLLGLEIRTFADYPTSETDPDAPLQETDVLGDVIYEINREGETLRTFSTFDLIDPYRLGYDSLSTPRSGMGDADWSHSNAILYDEETQTGMISVRNQDAVVKFDVISGEIIWILGPHENWSEEYTPYLLNPIDENTLWQYHQHAQEVLPNGNILLFDNGNYRASPPDRPLANDELFSRAVEYTIDEESMTVSQVWEYGQFIDEILYCSFFGDADYLPNMDNVLVTFGGSNNGRIVEVTHTTPSESVFSLMMTNENVSEGGYSIYRADRLHSLYPDDTK
jgi:hypothetical protein